MKRKQHEQLGGQLKASTRRQRNGTIYNFLPRAKENLFLQKLLKTAIIIIEKSFLRAFRVLLFSGDGIVLNQECAYLNSDFFLADLRCVIIIDGTIEYSPVKG